MSVLICAPAPRAIASGISRGTPRRRLVSRGPPPRLAPANIYVHLKSHKDPRRFGKSTRRALRGDNERRERHRSPALKAILTETIDGASSGNRAAMTRRAAVPSECSRTSTQTHAGDSHARRQVLLHSTCNLSDSSDGNVFARRFR